MGFSAHGGLSRDRLRRTRESTCRGSAVRPKSFLARMQGMQEITTFVEAAEAANAEYRIMNVEVIAFTSEFGLRYSTFDIAV